MVGDYVMVLWLFYGCSMVLWLFYGSVVVFDMVVVFAVSFVCD